jgi:hypothetical protein
VVTGSVIGGNAMTVSTLTASTLVTTGNVGIGTTTPNAPLQFATTVANRKIVLLESTNNDHHYYGFGVNSHTLRYQVDSTSSNHVFYAAASSSTSNELMRISGNGNVGIGTNAPNALLHVYGTGPTSMSVGATSAYLELGWAASSGQYNGSAAANDSIIRSMGGNLFLQAANQGNPSLVCNTNGNVGIGTTNPNFKLSIQGADSVVSGPHVAYYTTSNSNPIFQQLNYSADNIALLFDQYWDGQFRASVNSTVSYQIYKNVGKLSFNYAAGTTAGSAVTNTNAMTIISNGNVGIGTVSPTVPLHVVGSNNIVVAGGYYFPNNSTGLSFTTSNQSVGILCTRAIATTEYFLASSDMRIKKNIQHVTNSLEKLSKLDIVEYDKIDYKENGADIGIIAQNVETILPKSISKSTKYIPNIYERTSYELIDNGIRIFINSKEIQKNTKIRLYISKISIDKEIEYDTIVIKYTPDSFDIKKWDDYSEDDKVFVYGTEVDDFLSVDKDQIGILAAGGVKELHQIIKEQQTHIVQLESKLATQESQFNQLLAWAKTQGFQ